MYHQDTNSIHAEAFPNRQAASIRAAWERTHRHFVHHGHLPDLHILDNECSQDSKDAFLKYHIAFQRVPPKEHRANAAECAIWTFNNHIVSILCTVNSAFPLIEWDRLLPHARLTLNLLRSSRIHPSLSAYVSLYGNFDFNRTPLPAGTKVVANVSANTCTSFGKQGKLGWYIACPEHYHCYRCYFPEIMHECDVLKVDFSPTKFRSRLSPARSTFNRLLRICSVSCNRSPLHLLMNPFPLALLFSMLLQKLHPFSAVPSRPWCLLHCLPLTLFHSKGAQP